MRRRFFRLVATVGAILAAVSARNDNGLIKIGNSLNVQDARPPVADVHTSSEASNHWALNPRKLQDSEVDDEHRMALIAASKVRANAHHHHHNLENLKEHAAKVHAKAKYGGVKSSLDHKAQRVSKLRQSAEAAEAAREAAAEAARLAALAAAKAEEEAKAAAEAEAEAEEYLLAAIARHDKVEEAMAQVRLNAAKLAKIAAEREVQRYETAKQRAEFAVKAAERNAKAAKIRERKRAEDPDYDAKLAAKRAGVMFSKDGDEDMTPAPAPETDTDTDTDMDTDTNANNKQASARSQTKSPVNAREVHVHTREGLRPEELDGKEPDLNLRAEASGDDDDASTLAKTSSSRGTWFSLTHIALVVAVGFILFVGVRLLAKRKRELSTFKV